MRMPPAGIMTANRNMIVYRIKCDQGHEFEAWFKDGATFDRQAAAGEVACPECGATQVRKAPMAPRVHSGRAKETAARQEDARRRAAAALSKLQEHVERNFDNVGERFAEEARKIHYGEVEARGIYGQATAEQCSELDDEGIEVAAMPWVDRKRH